MDLTSASFNLARRHPDTKRRPSTQRKGVSGGVLGLLSRNGPTPRGHYESEEKQNLQPNCNTRGKKRHQTIIYRKLILVSKMCLVNTHLENILCVPRDEEKTLNTEERSKRRSFGLAKSEWTYTPRPLMRVKR